MNTTASMVLLYINAGRRFGPAKLQADIVWISHPSSYKKGHTVLYDWSKTRPELGWGSPYILGKIFAYPGDKIEINIHYIVDLRKEHIPWRKLFRIYKNPIEAERLKNMVY